MKNLNTILKHAVAMCLTISVGVFPLSACAPKKPDIPKIRIVATAFPYYNWVQNITKGNGGRFDVTLIMDTGADYHSFTPAPKDISAASACDLFIYTGGTSDAWADKLSFKQATVVLDMMDVLYGKQERSAELASLENANEDSAAPEGQMDSDSDDENPFAGFSGHDLSGQGDGTLEDTDDGMDEHVWLSLRNAQTLVKALTDEIISLDPDNKDLYSKNLRRYISQLQELDIEYTQEMKETPKDSLIIADRFPFSYLCADYSLTAYAAHDGCGVKADVPSDAVYALAAKADELNLHTILMLENSSRKTAESVRANTKKKTQRIMELDSMQSVTKEQVSGGLQYTDVMKKNLAVLRDALS